MGQALAVGQVLAVVLLAAVEEMVLVLKLALGMLAVAVALVVVEAVEQVMDHVALPEKPRLRPNHKDLAISAKLIIRNCTIYLARRD